MTYKRKIDWLMGASLEDLKALSEEQRGNVRDFGSWMFSSPTRPDGGMGISHLLDSDRVDDFIWRLYNVDYFGPALADGAGSSLLYDFIEWQQGSAHPVALSKERRDRVYTFVMEEYRRILLSHRQIKLLEAAVELWGLIPSHLSSAILRIEAQKMEDARRGGETCSVCNQLAKEYKVRFSVNMAVFLRSLVINYLQNRAEGGEGWIHYKECQFSSRNYPYVAYWGLASTRPDPAGKKRTSGEWKPTQRGIDFIFNRVTVPLYCFTYNGKATGFDTTTEIGVSEAFGGQEFDLSELMGLLPDEDQAHG